MSRNRIFSLRQVIVRLESRMLKAKESYMQLNERHIHTLLGVTVVIFIADHVR